MTARFENVDPVRRKIMAAVRGRNTKPEMIVRRLLFSLGYRFRLHRKDLPGQPDIVFVGRRKVVFVHGCFWHRHSGCAKATTPKTRTEFWNAKFDQNVERDRRTEQALSDRGWSSLVVWECETRILETLVFKLSAFLGDPSIGVAVGGAG